MSDHSARPWRGLAALVAGVLAVAACSGDDDEPSASAPVTTTAPSTTAAAVEAGFTFGLLGPGVGLLSDLTAGQARGLQLAVDDINAGGGVLGAPVAQIRADESADRPIADVISELVDEGSDVVVGPVGSETATSVVPLVAERELLACSASATVPSLTTDNAPRSFFRTAFRDDHLSAFVADRVMAPETGAAPKTVAVVARDDVYGSQLAAGLAAELTARHAKVDVVSYPSRRVVFSEEATAIVAADPDVVVMVAFAEGPALLRDVVDGGYPVERILGLDGMLVPRLASQAFPSDPTRADGLTIVGTTGDRAFTERLAAVPSQIDQLSYGAQMYDCAITLALAATAAGSTSPGAVGDEVRGVTDGGRTCSSYADCLALLSAGEDIDFDGATGGIAIDDHGDITTARVTTVDVIDGELGQRVGEDIDLLAERDREVFASAVFTTQVQQVLRVLGYYDGDITGVWDEATSDAVRALQRDLGLPETGTWDEATDAAARELAGDAADTLSASTADLQRALADLGFYDGPIDGVYSAETVAAVRALQAALGVPQTGVIDVATLRAAHDLDPRATPTTTTTAPAATTTTPAATTTPVAPTTTAPRPTTTAPRPTTTAPLPTTTAPRPTTTPAPPPPTTTTTTTTTTTVAPTTTTPPPPTAPRPPPPTTPPPPPPTTTPPPTSPPPTTPPPTTPPPTTSPPPTTVPPAAERTLFEVLEADPQFSTLVDVLRSVGFDGDLATPGAFTIFAPTNDAFAALPPGTLDELTLDPDRVAAGMAYHVVDSRLTGADLQPGPLVTVHGASVLIAIDGKRITVNDARVTEADIVASNGVIHAIDQVLVPPPAE